MPKAWTNNQYQAFLAEHFPHIEALESYKTGQKFLHRCKNHNEKFYSTQNNFRVFLKKKRIGTGCKQCSTHLVTSETLADRLNSAFGKGHGILVSGFQGVAKKAKFHCQKCGETQIRKPAEFLDKKFPCRCSRIQALPFAKITQKEHEAIGYLYNDLLFSPRQIEELTGLSSFHITKALAASGIKQDESERTLRRIKQEQIPELAKYRRIAHNITNQVYKIYQDILDPKVRRGSEYHIDHKFSIHDAFTQQVPYEILVHPANLALITAKSNQSKSSQSSVTLAKLKKKIKEWDLKHGKFSLPGTYSEFDFSTIRLAKAKKLRVLGIDPGTTNFAYTAVDIRGTQRIKGVKIIKRGVISGTVKLLTGNLHEDSGKFIEELRSLISEIKPDVVVYERYQSRGMKGTTIELVNMMIGMLMVMSWDTKFPIQGIMPSTWKNAVNRKFDLKEDVYAHMPKSKQHNLDAFLIACYAFPEKDRYRYFQGKEDQLVKLFG